MSIQVIPGEEMQAWRAWLATAPRTRKSLPPGAEQRLAFYAADADKIGIQCSIKDI